MNDNSLQYVASVFNGFVSHYRDHIPILRDGGTTANLDIDVQARSGDYFVTLASKLDELGKDIHEYGVRQQIEDIVSSLIYLQDNYVISKKEE